MFGELFLSACAVSAVFLLFGPTRAAVVAMPLLVWCVYRLGRAIGSAAVTKSQKLETKTSRISK